MVLVFFAVCIFYLPNQKTNLIAWFTLLVYKFINRNWLINFIKIYISCSIYDLSNKNKDQPHLKSDVKHSLAHSSQCTGYFGKDFHLNANKAVGPDIISIKMLISVEIHVWKPWCMLLSESLQKIFFNQIVN
jgi:hypothetical protein